MQDRNSQPSVGGGQFLLHRDIERTKSDPAYNMRASNNFVISYDKQTYIQNGTIITNYN